MQGLEIENHLKKKVRELEKKKVSANSPTQPVSGNWS